MDTTAGQAVVQCAECGTEIQDGHDRQQVDDVFFCRPCFVRLNDEVNQAIAAQSEGIGYPVAAVGGLAGAVLGVLVWCGFTVITGIRLGLVAVAIGFAVGKGVVMLSGNKRHLNLQLLAVGISFVAYVYASFLINRTIILQNLAEGGQVVQIALLPNPELFFGIVTAGAKAFDLIFLAIVIYEAWKIPAPLQLDPQS